MSESKLRRGLVSLHSNGSDDEFETEQEREDEREEAIHFRSVVKAFALFYLYIFYY